MTIMVIILALAHPFAAVEARLNGRSTRAKPAEHKIMPITGPTLISMSTEQSRVYLTVKLNQVVLDGL